MVIVHVFMIMYFDLPPIPTHCYIRHPTDNLCTLVSSHINTLANGVDFQTCLDMKCPTIYGLEKNLRKAPKAQQWSYTQAIN